MKKFYTTLIIIAASGILITFYYILKQVFKKYRFSKRHQNIWNKLYADERKLIESRLRNALRMLETQKIQWLICYSRNYPDLKFQFIYSVMEKKIQMDISGEYLWSKISRDLDSVGGVTCQISEKTISFFLPVNTKIAVDLIARCFYQITGQDKILNLSIKTSGV